MPLKSPALEKFLSLECNNAKTAIILEIDGIYKLTINYIK
jgi:hypothetical protein